MSARPLAVTAALLDGETVGLRCLDGTIAALGPDVAAQPGDETIDAAGAPLMRWLREVVWPIEAKLEPEDVYWGVRLACAEMIRTGTTRFWDMYWHPTATARACCGAGG